MNIRLLLSCLLIATAAWSQSNKAFNYTVDLTQVKDDKLYVELSVPKVKSDETVFYMPKIIPGTYSIADYGRFVSDFKAMDSKGKELKVEKLNDNSWKISGAKKLARISYQVDDSYDKMPAGPAIYPMAGTNIDEGKNFVLNTSGFFGYLEGQKDVPFNVNIIRPEGFYGSTGLIPSSIGSPLSKVDLEKAPGGPPKLKDTYSVEDYDRLIDSPIMYAKPDTAVIKVGNTEVLIGSYSPNAQVNAKEIAGTVRDILMSQKDYLGGKLPVDKYAFIFYFTDQPAPAFGALEHSYSSFYFLPEYPIDALVDNLRHVAAHEFFHIITPLTIHSHEIDKFDFNDPKMSKHLWLYEGMTEYFAYHTQVRSGLITPEQFLTEIRNKMNTSQTQFNDTLAFTELSSKTLDVHSSQYQNVYEKGALISMCLDIILRKNSNGAYGTRELALDLSKKYGKNSPFSDDELFGVITAMTYPEVGEFFKRYVDGPERLPFKYVFDLVGIGYIPEEHYRDKSHGLEIPALDFVKIPELEDKMYVTIKDATALNDQGKAFGFRDGDLIAAFNGQPLPAGGIISFLNRVVGGMTLGQSMSYTILRKDESGAYREQQLTAPAIEIEKVKRNQLSFDEKATGEQVKLRKAWLEGV